MTRSLLFRVVTPISFCVLFFCLRTSAQCVPDEVTISDVRGKVVSHLIGRDEPLSNVVVKVNQKKYLGKTIRSTRTDKDGRFDLGPLPKGSYVLVTSTPHLMDFYLAVVVDRKNPSSGALLIWLAADFMKECSGSYAELSK